MRRDHNIIRHYAKAIIAAIQGVFSPKARAHATGAYRQTAGTRRSWPLPQGQSLVELWDLDDYPEFKDDAAAPRTNGSARKDDAS